MEPNFSKFSDFSGLRSMLTGLRDQIASVAKAPEDRKISEIAVLLSLNMHAQIEQMLEASKDKAALYNLINEAVKISHGDDHAYTVHGVMPRFEKRFDTTAFNLIFSRFGKFQKQLLDELGIESFLTSGTLLGLIRDGKVISHDDDFDACYISKETDHAGIIKERFWLKAWLENVAGFSVIEATGGHFHLQRSDVPMFDLFTSWIEDGYFNEYPLLPNTLSAAEVTPVKTAEFYGTEVFVPKNPEALLALNYGPKWRTPDPTWRFDWHSTSKFYHFLQANRTDRVAAPQ